MDKKPAKKTKAKSLKKAKKLEAAKPLTKLWTATVMKGAPTKP